ncbi:anterior gradient protein 2 homolog [Narcine bancroftii]|uniref:anterior gradient protein 2 homolog n=1 Tax=Narcine bancroftii TaxID=1343680 RepID=UPI00383196D1
MPGLSLSLLGLLAIISACVARGPVGSKNAGKGPSKEHPKDTRCPPSLSRGWADEVNWVQTYEEGLYKTRKSNRPLMVIHHLEDCPFSQSLKKAFAADREIQKMAKEDFIMLNLLFETTDEHLYPDGQYVPRILFVDPSLTVRADIRGKYGNHAYAYEEGDIELLKANMKEAKKLLKQDL